MSNNTMDDITTRRWWANKVKDGYFTKQSFGFSYPKMDRFKLKDKTILVIGMGYGRQLVPLCKLSDHVFGIDLAPESLKLTMENLRKHKLNKYTLSTCNGSDIPFDPDVKFDFIHSCFVVQHMSKKNAKELIKNCCAKLKKGGKIFFEFFGHPEFMGGKDKDAFSGVPPTGMYNNAYTKAEINELVEDLPCKVDWIENWEINEKGKTGEMLKFNNYWVCFKK